MSAPRKVLWVSCVGETGGAEVYMLNLFRRLERARYTPIVALLRPGPLEGELNRLGIETRVLTKHRMRNVAAVAKAIGQLVRLIRREGIELVHGNCFRAHVYAGLAARLAGVPCVWLVHTAEQPGLSTSAILHIPVTRVVGNCERTVRYFVAQGLPTTLLYPGVDADHLAHQAGRAELAAKYGLPVNARWVIMGSRLQKYKGQEFFIRALAGLPPALGHVHGIIMGGTLFGMETGYPAELKSLASSLGVADRVHFTGFVPPNEELHGLLAASELLVHPALDEDFGLIVAEAQMIGRPVLAFASVGPAAIVADGETGRLIPVGDLDGLRENLVTLLTRPDLLTTWGTAGRERTNRLFSATSAAEQLADLYDGCLAARPG